MDRFSVLHSVVKDYLIPAIFAALYLIWSLAWLWDADKLKWLISIGSTIKTFVGFKPWVRIEIVWVSTRYADRFIGRTHPPLESGLGRHISSNMLGS
jgi:hypothetical protein